MGMMRNRYFSPLSSVVTVTSYLVTVARLTDDGRVRVLFCWVGFYSLCCHFSLSLVLFLNFVVLSSRDHPLVLIVFNAAAVLVSRSYRACGWEFMSKLCGYRTAESQSVVTAFISFLLPVLFCWILYDIFRETCGRGRPSLCHVFFFCWQDSH